MIIELFGPAGAGKTTFAHMLATRLREHGQVTELILSYRPAEHFRSLGFSTVLPIRRQSAPVMRRLGRPVVEMFAIRRRPFPDDFRTAANLVRLIPPKNIIWRIRLSQYIARLSHSWHRSCRAGHIVLFDQAFVQVVCSLVLLGRYSDEALVARALDSIPKPDLLVRLDASRDDLDGRLRERERRQSALERLFELDLKTNLDSMGIIDQLHALLQKRGQAVIRVSSLDPCAASEGADLIEAKLSEMHIPPEGMKMKEIA
jgi:thymidylate kinase